MKARSIAEVRELFWKQSTYFFDLDGTLYLGKNLLPGARELLWKLEQAKKKFVYLTNNSSRSDRDYVLKLRKLGFPVRSSQIRMSTHLLIEELKRKKWTRVFLLGTPAMKQMLRRSGIRTVFGVPHAVVVGFDKTLTYESLKRAVRLVDQGCPYVVTHPDLYCPTDEGPEPDCGAFAKAIELITKKEPAMVLGKPHPRMLCGVKKKGSILIGDRVSTDIEMAWRAGVESILVLSGETRRRDLKALKIKTRNILPSVRDLL